MPDSNGNIKGISTIGITLPPDMEKTWQEAVEHKLKQAEQEDKK